MVVEEVVNVSLGLVPGVVGELGRVVLWLQAIGVLLLLWIIFQLVMLWINYRRLSKLKELNHKLDSFEKHFNKMYRKLLELYKKHR
jgi:biopolymer transport protein ExbB/TolQ